MQILVSLRILGIILMFFSLSHLIVVCVALWYGEIEVTTFLVSAAITFTCGLLLSCASNKKSPELRTRDGFLIVSLVWTVVCLFGALPFLLTPAISMTLAEAVFESVSGLSTTGATVIVGLDKLPRALLYYRQQLHLLGGMGIIVLAVAILPLLGVGGLQLFRAEVSGPSKDNKLTPRITQTAKALWLIYMGLVTICAFTYWCFGMSLFDAICFSFSTIATGGFSPYDASFPFPQIALRLTAVFFMLLAVLNFSLHFLCLRHKTIKPYFKDEEVRLFFFIQILIVFLCVVFVFSHMTVLNPVHSFVEVLFQVISFSTTTGFTVTSYHLWPLFVPLLLMFAPLIGGCSGSTSGGIKVIRLLLLLKQGWREIKRMVHPHGYFLLKVNQQFVSTRISDAVWGFIGVYFCVFVVLLLMLMGFGLDFTTAFSGLMASITNLGPGLGNVVLHYGDVNEYAKWTFAFAMLLGRLELFTILILLTPMFWRD